MESLNKVVLDTNMLLSIVELKIDVFEEVRKKLGNCQFVIIEPVQKELLMLSKQGKKQSLKARIADRLIKLNHAKLLKVKEKTADLALEKLGANGYIIATNDKELRKNIKAKNGTTIFIKQKKFIEIE
ncbi:MAG: hypothetical protein Q7S21_07215 [archaeon]|nr:hypothetical protein [archaeon]